MARWEEFARSPHALRLECGAQHYDWGQRGEGAFIPALLGVPAGEKPWAELWIGAHPVRPSQALLAEEAVALPDLIAAWPDAILGKNGAKRFRGRMPFLLKVLGAERMLSIQAHPNKAQAEEGFAREEAAGVPRGAGERRYRDRNHKPELIVALQEFVALSGFRPQAEIAQALARHPELAAIAHAAGGTGSIEGLFTAVMGLAPGALDDSIGRLVSRLAMEDQKRPFRRDEHEFWMLRADRQFARDGRRDAGVLAMVLLNLVRLEPGQALFLEAGELHSYLEGVGVELMADSDNVLRGGLTSKHVDVAELTRVLTFRCGPARPFGPDPDGVYPTPAEEFELTAITLEAGDSWITPVGRDGPDVLLVTEGWPTLRAHGDERALPRGASVLVPAPVQTYELRAPGHARIFRATVP